MLTRALRLRRVLARVAWISTPPALVGAYLWIFRGFPITKVGPFHVLCDGTTFCVVNRQWNVLVDLPLNLTTLILLLPFALWVNDGLWGKPLDEQKWDLSFRGICWKCGYDLRGTDRPQCPECGTANERNDVLTRDPSAPPESQ